MTDIDATLQAWQPFFVAQIGAAAALLGLMFVGLSLNLARILANPSLPLRAEIGLLLLALQFITGSIMLVPDQGPRAIGIEMLVLAGGIWLITTVAAVRIVRMVPSQRAIAWQNLIILQFVALPYLAAAAMLLTGTPGALHAVALGMMLSFLKAGVDAWVLVIEINR